MFSLFAITHYASFFVFKSQSMYDLLYAARRGRTHIVTYLLKRKGSKILSTCDKNGNTAVLYTTIGGHLELLKWLLEHYEDEQKRKNFYGSTILLTAAREGHIDIVKYMLNSGKSSISEKCKFNYTALLHAVNGGHMTVVKWLLDEGLSQVTERSVGLGFTPLLLAVTQKNNLDMVKWLLQTGGSDITEHDIHGLTALLFAARNNNQVTVKWLLSNGGSSVTECCKNGCTLLHYVCANGNIELLQWLLETYGDTMNWNERDYRHFTPLLVAASQGYVHILQLLLVTKGVDMYASSRMGNDMLLCAAISGKLETVVWILEHGYSSIQRVNVNNHCIWKLLNWPFGKAFRKNRALTTFGKIMLLKGVPTSNLSSKYLQCTLDHAEKLRRALPHWLQVYTDVVQNTCKSLLPCSSLVDIVLSYATSHANDIWSEEMGVLSFSLVR